MLVSLWSWKLFIYLYCVYPAYGTMLGKTDLKDRQLKREGGNLNALQQKLSESSDPNVIYYFLSETDPRLDPLF